MMVVAERDAAEARTRRVRSRELPGQRWSPDQPPTSNPRATDQMAAGRVLADFRIRA